MTTKCYDCARVIEPEEQRQTSLLTGTARCMSCVEHRARKDRDVMARFDDPDTEMKREESQ